MSLIAKSLQDDPRIAQAKKLLLEAVEDHKKQITEVRPADPALKQNYEKLLSDFASYRGANLYFPYLGSGIGNGPLVELLDGSVKYDFICGIGPHYLGHSHPNLISSSIDAAISDTVMQGHLQQNVDAVALSKLLIQNSGLDHCFLTTSGAMANENALKIIFQKKFPANRILAFDHCFMGRTLAMSQITDKPSFREGLPVTYSVDYVPYFNPLKPEESTENAVKTLKNHLARYPKQHALMCFELVQGEGGFYSGTKHFFETLMTVLKEYNIAILDDEVQTFGRTTELFAFQHFGLDKYIDLVTIGKLSQVCATLYQKEFAPKPGLLSQTFIGSTSAIKAGKTIIEHLLSGNFFGQEGLINKTHRHFAKNLQEIADRHSKLIEGPFGIGAMIAFTPFGGDRQLVTKFVQKLFDAGIISFVAGDNPTRVRFLVPVGALTPHDIDKATEILENTLLKNSGDN